jgi:hypothetical protein
MAKIAERNLPFFKILRGSSTFQWRPEQQEAFEALKEYIQKLPTLASPHPDHPLIMYVLTTHTAVSGALVQEREISKEDKNISHEVPIYFVSEAQAGSKKYYSEMEKICYVLVVIKGIYLPLTYLHFIQDIQDRCLLLMSSTSFVDLSFQEHRMMEKHHMDQNTCISSLCPK